VAVTLPASGLPNPEGGRPHSVAVTLRASGLPNPEGGRPHSVAVTLREEEETLIRKRDALTMWLLPNDKWIT
jgi:hypothetical protein